MANEKDSMAGMTAAQKAAVLKGKQRSNKDKIAKMGPLEDTWIRDKSGLRAVAGRLSQGNVDMGKTIGRLESSKNRSETSAKYRLAKAKADKKMSKTSKVGKMLDRMEMTDAPRTPFLTKNKKAKNK